MIDNADSIEKDGIEEIAVIGLAGRFPGAKNVDQYWKNLRTGVDSITRFTDQELESFGVPSYEFNHPNYVKAGALLENIDMFDASFFEFNPREAEIIDPQHRIFLECAWEAIEQAGYNTESYTGSIGVYAGAGPNNYLKVLPVNADPTDVGGAFQTLISNEKDFLSTRVSHKFNLKGPSLTVQTACSTSLVATHLACQSLLNYQCSMALAGGVFINLGQKGGYFYQEGMIVSPDGYCRAFDAKAQGTVVGQGAGVVLLKRLSDALADGDTIYAVIKGSAINNDGSLKVSYTAPNVDGQTEVILKAQALGEVSADTLGYVETHGTGTSLGDPIEIAALTQAFRASTDKKKFCAIGSVKTNIGHLDAAAGVASLIKTVLALKHKEIPPSLHFDEPNPNIDFENSPFFVNTKLKPWKSNGTPLRAGVSSFGIGGTNAHAVLEEAPTVVASGKSKSWQLLVLSAKTRTALEAATMNLVEHLKQNQALDFNDVAYTLQVGRQAFNHRRMVVCQGRDDALTTLESMDAKRVLTTLQEPINRDVVFMFPGQGSQYVNMANDLYNTETKFKEEIDRCSEMLKPQLGLDLRDVLYPDETKFDEATRQLKNTLITQPALFVIEYALAKLWMAWGVHPQVLVGHSIGEYVAACLAGVFSLEEALVLVATRGRLMQELPGGSMLAVSLSEKETLPFLGQSLSLAAVNSPSLCVVSGKNEAIEHLEQQLMKRNVVCQHLHTSHAFHSKTMDPILEPFAEQVRKIKLDAPQIPIVSTVTGKWITSDEITSPKYWAQNLRQTVRFSDCAGELLKDPHRAFLEVGPGQTLTTLMRQHAGTVENVFLSSTRHPMEQKSDVAFIINTLGRLWLAGIQVDWTEFFEDERRYRVPLPTYPFERQRYWTASSKQIDSVKTSSEASSTNSLPQHKKDIADWFYVPSWKRSINTAPDTEKPLVRSSWLLFVDDHGLGAQLASRLELKNQTVFTVRVGNTFAQVGGGAYTINPRQGGDYDELFSELRTLKQTPQRIVHLWSTRPKDHKEVGLEGLEKIQDVGIYSLLSIAQAIGKQDSSNEVRIDVISNGIHEVTGEEALFPENATVLGPCKVIPLEYSNTICKSIDVDTPRPGSKQEAALIDQLLAEFDSNSSEPIVAYRGSHRWVQTFEPVRMDETLERTTRLRDGGVYLITGGLGGIGLALAENIAATVRAKLILTSRSNFPVKDEWEGWLATHDEDDGTSRKIRTLEAIEGMDTEVLVANGDVANLEQMRKVIALAHARFGRINGVIHSAGVVDQAGAIQRRSREMTESGLASKVRGTLIIDRLLKDVRLDFMLLCSSSASILYHNRFGQVSYVTANSFLDAYAHYKTLKDDTLTVTINWDDWQKVGMSEEANKNFMKLFGKHERLVDPLDQFSPSEGTTVFRRILNNIFPQVIVSTRDLRIRIEQDEFVSSPFLEAAARADLARPAHARPVLSSSYVAPGTATEQSIAEIWQQLLGIDKVGVHDNFFELGGDSLLATQVIARLKSEFSLDFTMASLFDRPTVHLLSKLILEGQNENSTFSESSVRAKKRKERKRQRIVLK